MHIYLKELCLVYLCTKFRICTLKTTEFCYFEVRNSHFFALFPVISVFCQIFKFVRFVLLERCYSSIFLVIDEKLAYITPPTHIINFQFDLFYIVTLDDVDL